MHESEKWKWSRSFVSDSSRPHRLQPTRLLHPWDFPGKSTGVGCHCLIHVFTCYVFTITSLKKNELYLLLSNPYFLIVFKNIYIYFKIWLYWVLIVAHRIFRCSRWTLSCSFQTLSFSMCDLVPWPGIEPRPPALEALSFSHWTIILVPNPYWFFFFFFLTAQKGSPVQRWEEVVIAGIFVLFQLKKIMSIILSNFYVYWRSLIDNFYQAKIFLFLVC